MDEKRKHLKPGQTVENTLQTNGILKRGQYADEIMTKQNGEVQNART